MKRARPQAAASRTADALAGAALPPGCRTRLDPDDAPRASAAEAAVDDVPGLPS